MKKELKGRKTMKKIKLEDFDNNRTIKTYLEGSLEKLGFASLCFIMIIPFVLTHQSLGELFGEGGIFIALLGGGLFFILFFIYIFGVSRDIEGLALYCKNLEDEQNIKDKENQEMDNIMQIAMIDKKEFFDKFKSNDKIRFLFGYKNKEKYDSDDYFEMTLRVWVDEKYFNEIYNNSKAKDDLDAMILFEKTSFFKELRKQTIKIDFLSQNFIVPDFFKEHNIKIIPYFQLCNDEDLTTKQFFKFLKEMKVDKLNYITYILGDDLIEDEYRHIHK